MQSQTPLNIQETNITTEMRECYIDYAMSVIIGRALPDVRDGLKPVHRRILYAMHELGLTPDRPFRKSVRIVGDVLGKFHPHGDAAVYEAMVRMAQDFSTRYPTVKGHGNFGSVDGDSAAAMRYTEAKMDVIAREMLRDINKDTVNFVDNFDGTEVEPVVLTSRFPHLLVNGSQGIAVGMATIAYIKDEEIPLEKLIKLLPGPDFPTGGQIIGRSGIKDAYSTGKGRIKIRAKAEIEPGKRGKHHIVISEIPYMVNKAKVIEKISSLVHAKKIEGIQEIRDESDLKQGIRIVIDVRKNYDPNYVLHQIYKMTDLETGFGVINLALVPDKKGKLTPKILDLKSILKEYLAHQETVIERRTRYDLQKAQKRAHILEGLLIALDHIDEIIEIIRSSRTPKSAGEKLKKRFKIDDVQAQAILDMRLQRLTGLERGKIKKEHKELLKTIAQYEKILSDKNEVRKVIIEELRQIKKDYADKRRTEILDEEPVREQISFVKPKKEIYVALTDVGYVNQKSEDKFERFYDGDVTTYVLKTNDSSPLIFVTDKARAYTVIAGDIPSSKSRGTHLSGIASVGDGENVIAVFDYEALKKKNLLLATKNGLVKKIKLEDVKSSTKNGVGILTLKPGDLLVSAIPDTKDVLIATENGMALRFDTSQIKPQGRTAAGVKGITLEDDTVVSLSPVKKEVIVAADDGTAKRVVAGQFKKQARGGKGLKIIAKGQKIRSVNTSSGEDLYYQSEDGSGKVGELPQTTRTKKGTEVAKNLKRIYVLGTGT